MPKYKTLHIVYHGTKKVPQVIKDIAMEHGVYGISEFGLPIDIDQGEFFTTALFKEDVNLSPSQLAKALEHVTNVCYSKIGNPAHIMSLPEISDTVH